MDCKYINISKYVRLDIAVYFSTRLCGMLTKLRAARYFQIYFTMFQISKSYVESWILLNVIVSLQYIIVEAPNERNSHFAAEV